ncbi:MAG TPA: sigma-70 family RNA polymerase sigma factor [Bryobacteraceae bacterium]|nr:sigma-70 family RNA polymerase sigma factor [Bryobacteraceae bacterium]
MNVEKSGAANVQQHARIWASAHPAFDASASARARWPHVFDARTEELKRRVSVLYETSCGRIYRFLISRGLNPPVAQEVAHDVFVDFFHALENGTPIECEQRWLFAVAGRTVVDHWRRKRDQMQVDFDSERSAVANVRSSEPTPEAQAERKERLARLASGLRTLPDEQRLCIRLRAEGLRYREIGKALCVPTSTAAQWIVSAICSLRAQVDGDSPLAKKRATARYDERQRFRRNTNAGGVPRKTNNAYR